MAPQHAATGPDERARLFREYVEADRFLWDALHQLPPDVLPQVLTSLAEAVDLVFFKAIPGHVEHIAGKKECKAFYAQLKGAASKLLTKLEQVSDRGTTIGSSLREAAIVATKGAGEDSFATTIAAVFEGPGLVDTKRKQLEQLVTWADAALAIAGRQPDSTASKEDYHWMIRLFVPVYESVFETTATAYYDGIEGNRETGFVIWLLGLFNHFAPQESVTARTIQAALKSLPANR